MLPIRMGSTRLARRVLVGSGRKNGCQPNQIGAKTHCYGANYPINDITASHLHIYFSNPTLDEKRMTCGEGIYPRWAAKQPQQGNHIFPDKSRPDIWGPLRAPAGINPLATNH
jgi:hypothetical protein